MMRAPEIVDVLVVGGGHAGCEAALAAARLGRTVRLVTGSIDRIAAMSCNPAIGGVGKGHLVKELDVLGGEMGRIADETGIHFRTLNESRGPAVRATRCQSDMDRYAAAMRRVVLGTPGLFVEQADVVALAVDDRGRAAGVRCRDGRTRAARCVILTTGTFLGGQLHQGAEKAPGGRAGEAPAAGLSQSLAQHGLTLGRLKTGTCPRLDARTIDFSPLAEQKPGDPAPRFSFDSVSPPALPQVSCFLTHTTPETHDVIRTAIATGVSPLFNGQIDATGPRYCPSVEDKVVRFPDKESHHVFLEPQGLDTPEVYPNGLSTSLPPEAQRAFLRTMPGLEQVEVTRFGYAVEYDFVDPTTLRATLESRVVPGLYCAGQLNGTTGYEEAAIQGLLAGVNAALALRTEAPLILERHEAYAGVLVDDLITKGTTEPYRMLTSRAEHRLILREDNVHVRLAAHRDRVGLVSSSRRARMEAFEGAVQTFATWLSETRVYPSAERNALLAAVGSVPLVEPMPLWRLVRRPEVTTALALALARAEGPLDGAPPPSATPPEEVLHRAAVEVTYAGYIERAERERARDQELDDAPIPELLFGDRLPGLSREVHEKLVRVRPRTLGQASRIPGMTPAAIGLLAAHVRRAQGVERVL